MLLLFTGKVHSSLKIENPEFKSCPKKFLPAATTKSSSLLFNLLRLEGNSTEATYAKDLAEEIEKEKGTFVVRNEEKTSKRTAIDVTREAGMKANEFVKGESYLARIIQAIWGINNSTTVV